ncbi:MAG: response regulator transcription factor, partial [Campylobacterales bacterium]
DEESVREPLSRTLKLLFKNVICAANGKEALEKWRDNQIHIILTDYMMPIVDGMDFIKEVRKTDRKTPIIILSSHSDKEKLKEAIKVNLIDYLEKPVTLDDLFNTFKIAVGQLESQGMLQIQIDTELSYNRINKILEKDGESILLTKNEAETLGLLLDKKSSLVTYDEISQKVYNGEMSHHQLKNTIGRLKKKLGDGVISNIKELGYTIK